MTTRFETTRGNVIISVPRDKSLTNEMIYQIVWSYPFPIPSRAAEMLRFIASRKYSRQAVSKRLSSGMGFLTSDELRFFKDIDWAYRTVRPLAIQCVTLIGDGLNLKAYHHDSYFKARGKPFSRLQSVSVFIHQLG